MVERSRRDDARSLVLTWRRHDEYARSQVSAPHPSDGGEQLRHRSDADPPAACSLDPVQALAAINTIASATARIETAQI